MVADHDIGMSMDREASRYVPCQVYTSGMRVREYSHTSIWAQWAKSLGNRRTAALFINGGGMEYSASISLAELGVSAAGDVKVTDVWTGADAGPVEHGNWSTGTVPSLDSRFVVFEASS